MPALMSGTLKFIRKPRPKFLKNCLSYINNKRSYKFFTNISHFVCASDLICYKDRITAKRLDNIAEGSPTCTCRGTLGFENISNQTLKRLSIKLGPNFFKNSELRIWLVDDDLDLFHHFSMVILAPFCKNCPI